MPKKSKHIHHQHEHPEHHIQHHEHHHSAIGGEKMIEVKLLENLVSLQKIHTNMAEKFDKLSNQITQLLSLFEMTAKTFAQNPTNMVTEKDKDFLEKIDKLLEQNKTIARGLTLMEERVRDRVTSPVRPLMQTPAMPQLQNNQQPEKGEDEFEMSSLGKPLPKF